MKHFLCLECFGVGQASDESKQAACPVCSRIIRDFLPDDPASEDFYLIVSALLRERDALATALEDFYSKSYVENISRRARDRYRIRSKLGQYLAFDAALESSWQPNPEGAWVGTYERAQVIAPHYQGEVEPEC